MPDALLLRCEAKPDEELRGDDSREPSPPDEPLTSVRMGLDARPPEEPRIGLGGSDPIRMGLEGSDSAPEPPEPERCLLVVEEVLLIVSVGAMARCGLRAIDMSLLNRQAHRRRVVSYCRRGCWPDMNAP